MHNVFMYRELLKQDVDYPELLRDSIRAPEKIYAYGSDECMGYLRQRTVISIVGSRHISQYGIRCVETFISGMRNTNVMTVSGYMYGCDYYVHYYSIKYGIPTVAVLPCGVKRELLHHSPDIYQIMIKNGLFISEYPDYVEPKKWDFVLRNRIISGLSIALLVVEARGHSGSLTTAEFSRKNKRQVFVVPGSIYSTNSLGIHEIYKLGGLYVQTPDELLLNMGINKSNSVAKITEEKDPNSELKKHKLNLTPVERKVWEVLSLGPQKPAELCDSIDLSLSDLTNVLGTLTEKDFVLRSSDGVYSVRLG